MPGLPNLLSLLLILDRLFVSEWIYFIFGNIFLLIHEWLVGSWTRDYYNIVSNRQTFSPE